MQIYIIRKVQPSAKYIHVSPAIENAPVETLVCPKKFTENTSFNLLKRFVLCTFTYVIQLSER